MKVKLQNVRIAFAQGLFKPRGVQGSEPRYSSVFVFEPESAAARALSSALKDVAAEAWGEKGPTVLAKLVKDNKVCYVRQAKVNADGEPYEGFEGMHYVTASLRPPSKPTVLGRTPKNPDGTPNVVGPDVIYSGCVVNALIDVWAQDNEYGRRINASLLGVQFVADGPAFGSGRPAKPDEFDDLGEPESGAEGLV